MLFSRRSVRMPLQFMRKRGSCLLALSLVINVVLIRMYLQQVADLYKSQGFEIYKRSWNRRHPGNCFIASSLKWTRETNGIGNKMLELAAFVAFADQTDRVPVVDDKSAVRKILHAARHLPNLLQLLQWNQTECHRPTSVVQTQAARFAYSDILWRRYANEVAADVSLVAAVDEVLATLNYLPGTLHADIKTLFWTNASLSDRVVDLLFGSDSVLDDFNICLHIRRGDYVKFHNMVPEFLPSSEGNVAKIGRYLEEKYSSRNPQVILLGNDLTFTEKVAKKHNWKTANFSSANPAVIDWEFSRIGCDVVGLTAPVSSYGLWLGYVSRGQRVYYGNQTIYVNTTAAEYYPPFWTHLDYNDATSHVTEFH